MEKKHLNIKQVKEENKKETKNEIEIKEEENKKETKNEIEIKEEENKIETKEEENKKEFNTVIGIDLGTTNSCVGIWRNGKVEIVPNEIGERTTPSVVYFDFDKNERLIGKAAKNKNEHKIYDAKRLIGRNYDDKEIEEDMKYWPFKVIKDDNNRPLLEIEYYGKIEQFYPEEISAMILSKLKKNAEDYYGYEIKDAIITVPAYFNDLQRQCTKNAGIIAGLNVIKIINEPTAAAIAYGFDKNNNEKKKYILVFDFGGGTLDVTILLLDNNIFEVKSTCGNSHLGGNDLDNELMKYCINEFKKETNINLSNDIKAINKLKKECEIGKIAFSNFDDFTFDIYNIIEKKSLYIEMHRQNFEDICQKYFDECFVIIEKALKDANLKKEEIDDVILVGGSSKIPKINEMIKDYFNKEPCKSINPDEVVAIGATIQAVICNNIGNEKTKKELLLLDVTPLSIGISCNKKMDFIIPRNTTIPCNKTINYKTVNDNQKIISFKIYQGESNNYKDNIYIGKFKYENISSKEKGKIIIQITFSLDINGILTVSANELGNDNEMKIEYNRLYNDKVDELIKKFENFECDKKKKELRRTCELYLQKGSENQKNKANEIIKWYKNNHDLEKKIYQEKLNEMKNCH